MTPYAIVAGSLAAAALSVATGAHTIWFGPWLVLAAYVLWNARRLG